MSLGPGTFESMTPWRLKTPCILLDGALSGSKPAYQYNILYLMSTQIRYKLGTKDAIQSIRVRRNAFLEIVPILSF